MARQEVTQVQQYPIVPVAQDNTVDQLRAIVRGAGNLTADIINLEARGVKSEAEAKDNAFRLSLRKLGLSTAIQQEGLESQLGAERMKSRTLAELTSAAEANAKALKENELNGALAILARTDNSKLPAMAKDMGIVDPENLVSIDQAIGQRRAMNDYPQVLRNFLSDPSKTPSEHLIDWMSNADLPSDNQEAAYAETLTRYIRQDEERSIRDRIMAGNKIGYENAVWGVERDAAINAGQWAAEPSKITEALKNFHATAVQFNPATSNLDVAAVLSQKIIPTIMGQLDVYEGLKFAQTISASDSPYIQALGQGYKPALLSQAESAVRETQKRNADGLKAALTNVREPVAMLNFIQSFGKAAGSGALNAENVDEIEKQLRTQSNVVRQNTRIEGKLNGNPAFAGSSIAGGDQDLYAQALQKRRADYLAQNGQQLPLDQDLRMQLGAGSISNDTKEQIDLLTSAPIVVGQDGSVDPSGPVQGIRLLKQIKNESPNVWRDEYLNKKDKLSAQTRIAVGLSDAGYTENQVLQYLSKAQGADLATGEKVATELYNNSKLDKMVRKATGPRFYLGWFDGLFDASADGTSKKAIDLSKDLFAFYYGTSTVSDADTRKQYATEKVKAEIGSRWDRLKIDTRTYMVDKDALPASMVENGRFSRVVTNGLVPAGDAFLKTANIRLDANPGITADYHDFMLNMDEMSHDDKNITVPVYMKGAPVMNDKGEQLKFSFPVDPVEQKAFIKDSWNQTAKQISEWAGKEVKPFSLPNWAGSGPFGEVSR